MDSQDDINKVYIDARWNNEYKYASYLPEGLKQKLNSEKTIFQRYDEYTNITEGQKPEKQPTSLIRYEDDSSNKIIKKVLHEDAGSDSLLERYEKILKYKPSWHPPWKLSKIINGHAGWVRCIAVEPIQNEWFATGSNDTSIKIWDLASGRLKLTLSGHVMTVRDLKVSSRHPYMFSASEDKLTKCWDLERNTVIRSFHGHLSGVHTVDIHPTLDVIATAGRDSVIRLWDIRSRSEILVLAGHRNTINAVKCLPVDPQIVSCSADATIRLWDIVAGKSMKVLTHHKRNVRSMAFHPSEFSFSTGSTDDIRSWKLPEGQLLTNFNSEGTGIVNSLSVNTEDVLFAGGDDGNLNFYDYKSGHKFQNMQTSVVQGSLDGERSILCSSFDATGKRLITGQGDKSIRIFKEIPGATVDSDPGLPWNPSRTSQRF